MELKVHRKQDNNRMRNYWCNLLVDLFAESLVRFMSVLIPQANYARD